MLIDARTVPKNKTIDTEVCIIGAGAAGITIARELVGRPFRVCLLESGGFEFEPETQDLYGGENTGFSYHPLDGRRLRYFGGTTNIGGVCRPLGELGFRERSWVPHVLLDLILCPRLQMRFEVASSLLSRCKTYSYSNTVRTSSSVAQFMYGVGCYRKRR